MKNNLTIRSHWREDFFLSILVSLFEPSWLFIIPDFAIVHFNVFVQCPVTFRDFLLFCLNVFIIIFLHQSSIIQCLVLSQLLLWLVEIIFCLSFCLSVLHLCISSPIVYFPLFIIIVITFVVTRWNHFCRNGVKPRLSVQLKSFQNVLNGVQMINRIISRTAACWDK